jgi:small subunit ribosomal protein S1
MTSIDLSEAKMKLKQSLPSNEELERLTNEIFQGIELQEFLDKSNRAVAVESIQDSIIQGTVISITTENILVDYGAKMEGVLPYKEEGFTNDDLDVSDVTHFLIKSVDDNGNIKLSRKNVDALVYQQETLSKLAVGITVEVKLSHQVKNGWVVDIAGLAAFLPSNQEYLVYPMEGAASLIGTYVEAEIESIVGKQVIVSRKIFATETKKQVKKEFLNSLNVGDLVDGTIKNQTEFGVFIQISAGIIGLCHATDQGLECPKVGQKVKARILKIDRDKNRVSLGIRQVTEPSWAEIVGKYAPDDKVIGRVKSIVPYGAFLEIEPGVSGLVHVSDLSWSDHIKHPKEMLSEGQQVEVIILGIDVDKQHLSLGLKQAIQDPWATITDRYLVGSVISGKVTNKTKFGIFVEMESGIEGLAHHTISSKNLQLGEVVKCSVSRIDLEKKKISLALED